MTAVLPIPTETMTPLCELFESLYVPVDGSELGDRAAEVATTLAAHAGARVVASHAYAARLHDDRFRQMEGGLPEPFQQETELRRQRKIHDNLITRGLELISESYLDQVEKRTKPLGVKLERRVIEGRNWRVLLDDVTLQMPDVVVLGAMGLGRVANSTVGTVCERLVRRLKGSDALVIRQTERLPWEHMLVAVDGSAEALGAVRTACVLAKAMGGTVELLSSFDPEFHHTMFRAISRALSKEAARVFRFEQQQTLHEEIIDDGLARIYQGHLDAAGRLCESLGVTPIQSTLLSGKAAVCVANHALEVGPSMVMLGRVGFHSNDDIDLGGCTEQILRTPLVCDLFLSARGSEAPESAEEEDELTWTHEARALLQRVPEFVQGMVAGAVTRHARDQGHTVVTSDMIQLVREKAHHGGGGGHHGGGGGHHGGGADNHRPPAVPPAPTGELDVSTMPWTEEAEASLSRIPDGFMRTLTRQRIEDIARKLGKEEVDSEAVSMKFDTWSDGSAKAERELPWDDDALARVQRIPEFIRGNVVRELERKARSEGLDRISAKYLDAARQRWSSGEGFHG